MVDVILNTVIDVILEGTGRVLLGLFGVRPSATAAAITGLTAWAVGILLCLVLR